MAEFDETERKPLTTEEIADRVSLLIDFLHCNGKIYYWKYTPDGNILETNSPQMVFDTVCKRGCNFDALLSLLSSNDKPVISSISLGMTWCAVAEKNQGGSLRFIHVLGPIFNIPVSDESVTNYVNNPKVRASWRPKFVRYIKALPVISATAFFKYTLMLFLAVNDRHLKPSEIIFSKSERNDFNPDIETQNINYAQTYVRDSSMMKLISTGDIYYKQKLPGAASMLAGQYPASDKEFPRIRQNSTIFLGLCIRAAIDGGISPDAAYSKGSVYLDEIMTVKNYAELLSITHSAFEDFIFMVHNSQSSEKYSEEIQACIDYINNHTESPLDIGYLAPKIGYADYYLSRKFKTETGMSINSYIKKARIERACYLLVTTDEDILSISERLRFGDRSFFAKTFKAETGSTPAAYRDSHRRVL